MGIRDRLTAAKRYVWSPITVTMLGQDSDPVVRAGHTARVIVLIEGEADDTAERIEVRLELNEFKTWSLGEVPLTAGRHELELLIPAEAPPTSRWTTYFWQSELHRSKGISPKALCPVRVIGHPEHVFWPAGPRSGGDGGELSLERETVNAGEVVSGFAPGAEKVEAGSLLDLPEGTADAPVQTQRFEPFAEARPGDDGAFRLEIPADAQPTLFNGDRTRVTWEVRATFATGSAWRRFAVLDPEGRSDVPEREAGALIDLFTTTR